MQLQAKLDAMKADFVAKVDPAILEAMTKAKEAFDPEAMMSGVVQPGDRAPDFTLEDGNGTPVSSAELRSRGPLLITFYRGVW